MFIGLPPKVASGLAQIFYLFIGAFAVIYGIVKPNLTVLLIGVPISVIAVWRIRIFWKNNPPRRYF